MSSSDKISDRLVLDKWRVALGICHPSLVYIIANQQYTIVWKAISDRMIGYFLTFVATTK